MKVNHQKSLSVIIITLNEERNLSACLESVVDIAQEIIIIDSGSQDKTAAIAKQFGAHFILNQKWSGFGAQKNLALSYVNYPWILSIDADERLTPELRAEILAILDDPSHHGYLLPRQSYFLGRPVRYSGWFPDYVLRLFQRDYAKFSDDLVHECVLVEGPIGKLKYPLQHYSYYDEQDITIKINRYAQAGAQQMYQKGKIVFKCQAWLHAVWTWLRTFVLKLGILDGKTGWHIAKMNAQVAYKKYTVLYRLWKNNLN